VVIVWCYVYVREFNWQMYLEIIEFGMSYLWDVRNSAYALSMHDQVPGAANCVNCVD
jgi:hypothetical protein